MIPINVYSQCDNINVSVDRFTKVSTKSTKKELAIKDGISTLRFSMTVIGDCNLHFHVWMSQNLLGETSEVNHFSHLTFLFTDGTTIKIGDEYEMLDLNTNVLNHKRWIEVLKIKKIEAIRVTNLSNYDFDLTVEDQEYILQNINCLFP